MRNHARAGKLRPPGTSGNAPSPRRPQKNTGPAPMAETGPWPLRR